MNVKQPNNDNIKQPLINNHFLSENTQNNDADNWFYYPSMSVKHTRISFHFSQFSFSFSAKRWKWKFESRGLTIDCFSGLFLIILLLEIYCVVVMCGFIHKIQEEAFPRHPLFNLQNKVKHIDRISSRVKNFPPRHRT